MFRNFQTLKAVIFLILVLFSGINKQNGSSIPMENYMIHHCKFLNNAIRKLLFILKCTNGSSLRSKYLFL